MSQKILESRVFTDGAARYSDLVYILSKDKKMSEEDIPHTSVIGVDMGKWVDCVDTNWNATAISVAKKPTEKMVLVGEDGQDSSKRRKKKDKPSKRETGESNLCPEAEHRHDTPYNQKSAHTEARLLDGLGKGGFPTSGTLTLKIDWRPNGEKGRSSPMPCKSCHKLLCAAAKCGIKIYLCDKKNKKKKLTKKHCPHTDDSYKELKKTMIPTKPKL